MHVKYFGDSFDLVKQCLLRSLSSLGPWAAHPMFTEPVGAAEAGEFSNLLGVPLLSTEVLTQEADRAVYFAPARACAGHLFLDPDKGIWVGRSVKRAQAPLYILMDEFARVVCDRAEWLTLVFDQSLPRGRERVALAKKLAALADRGIHAWAYVSQACFVLAGCDCEKVMDAANVVLAQTRIPASRLIYGPTLLEGGRMDPAIERVVGFLARNKTRATYGAVGEAVGVPARSVSALLGIRCPRASWVVNAKTGEPTGYKEHEKDPNLHRVPEIITTGDDLVRRMKCEPSPPACRPPSQ